MLSRGVMALKTNSIWTVRRCRRCSSLPCPGVGLPNRTPQTAASNSSDLHASYTEIDGNQRPCMLAARISDPAVQSLPRLLARCLVVHTEGPSTARAKQWTGGDFFIPRPPLFFCSLEPCHCGLQSSTRALGPPGLVCAGSWRTPSTPFLHDRPTTPYPGLSAPAPLGCPGLYQSDPMCTGLLANHFPLIFPQRAALIQALVPLADFLNRNCLT
jgi:hypothetical protein